MGIDLITVFGANEKKADKKTIAAITIKVTAKTINLNTVLLHAQVLSVHSLIGINKLRAEKSLSI